MRILVSASVLAAAALIQAGLAMAGASLEENHLAVGSCAAETTQPAGVVIRELSEAVEDKGSTDLPLSLVKEYLEFHGQAQESLSARGALMPWSDLATRAN